MFGILSGGYEGVRNSGLIKACGFLILAASGCAPIIVDSTVRVQLVASVKSQDGVPLADVELRFVDGLYEKAIGATGVDGTATVDHIFLWSHRHGAKNPPPPQFTLVLDRVGCKPYTTKQTLARGGLATEPPRVAVDAILQCADTASNGTSAIR